MRGNSVRWGDSNVYCPGVVFMTASGGVGRAVARLVVLRQWYWMCKQIGGGGGIGRDPKGIAAGEARLLRQWCSSTQHECVDWNGISAPSLNDIESAMSSFGIAHGGCAILRHTGRMPNHTCAAATGRRVSWGRPRSGAGCPGCSCNAYTPPCAHVWLATDDDTHRRLILGGSLDLSIVGDQGAEGVSLRIGRHVRCGRSAQVL